ncbi:helix-turn-helix domain-containing protein [Streptomyces sp. CC224B]|uniref:RNA polymerase sigma factor n=1 Tax=Streptomyces sp. CC224B TaxID=3044571 RepID=UPI0024A8D024|nr:helix-turn-helix domain-containing protein [Streptomyces sp. CC224B]
MIRSQRVYERCRAQGRFVAPTSAELEALRGSPEDRDDLAGDTLLKALEKAEQPWATWDARKGASLETYVVGALLLHFPRVFSSWRKARGHRQEFRRRLVTDAAAATAPARTGTADPALAVVARDVLERVLRTADPDVRVILVLVAAGYPRRAIAERLRISERAVEGRLHRFRREIRDSALGQDVRDVLREQASLRT